MSRFPAYACAFAAGLLLISLPPSKAFAHCFVGARFFPATLAIDDPCVADELSLPTVSWSKTGDVPPATEWDVSGELSRRITEDFGISIGEELESDPPARRRHTRRVRRPGNDVPVSTPQGRFARNGDDARTYCRLGQHRRDQCRDRNVLQLLIPTYYFGQGFGQLPDDLSWARPFAVTGQVGYQIPTSSYDVAQGFYIPQVLVYGASLQYSMPYLKSEVKDLQLADFVNHLIFITEAQFSTPVANNLGNSYETTGTINPGVIYIGSTYQIGIEAVIPVNSASGTGVGFLAQLHLYLDDMFPSTFGQPLIGGSSTPPGKAPL